MAVFVFGIVLGNKEALGFRMEAGEAQKLDEYVLTTAFIMRVFIFILLGAQVDFDLMRQYWFGGIVVVAVLMLIARPLTVFACALPDRRARWSFREMLFMCWTRETRRHSGRACRSSVRYEGAGRADDRIGHLHRRADDDPDPGADHRMARA